MFVPCDTEFRRMALKTIGQLFYATSTFVYHFVAIGKFKLELQSGNAQSGSKTGIFCSVWPEFDGWPWKIIGYLFYATPRFVLNFLAICEFRLELWSGNIQFGSKSAIFFNLCDLETWLMTLKKIGQTGFITWKRLSWVLTYVNLTPDLDLCMDITSVNVNNCSNLHHGTIMGT